MAHGYRKVLELFGFKRLGLSVIAISWPQNWPREDGGDALQGEDGGVGDGCEGEQSRILEFSVFWKFKKMCKGSNVHQRQRWRQQCFHKRTLVWRRLVTIGEECSDDNGKEEDGN